ncbi:MAG: hypothetical protein ABJA87_07065 [bacterium]
MPRWLRDRDRARAPAAELGAPHAYGGYDELYADADVDVSHVAMVHTEHFDYCPDEVTAVRILSS